MAGEQFSLVWNSFPTNLSSGLYSLLTDEHLVDVTLAAEGKILRAHKLILSVCSSYFRDLFKGNTCKHPIVILKDVNYRDLSAMLHFMYQGEVHIKQEDIASFLKVAETLQIKGLTRDANQKRDKPEEESSGAERLEETIKSEKEYEDDHEVEEQEEEEEEEEIQVDEENDEKEVEKIEQMEQQHSLNLPSDNLSTRDDNTDDIASSSSLTTLQNDNNLKNDTNIQALPSSIFMDTEQQLQNTITQPLNCTSENIDQDITDDNDKPLDYRFGVTQSTSLSISNTTTKKQIQSPTESSSYHSDYQEESPEINQGENRLDDAAFRTRAAKGRRTVKGIPHSTLPLETTLRVVSELGPTLRVDRGKVVRMYSCPWCLRHFTRKENLKLHVRYIHGPLESLTCKLCGNKYKNSNSLRVHSYLYHNTKRNKHNNSLVGSNT